MMLLGAMSGSVWQTMSGQEIDAGTRQTVGGQVIPKGSKGLANIRKATVDSQKVHGTERVEDLINVQWKFVEGHDTEGNDLAGRVVFQKLRIWDLDEGKANKARMMLSALDNLVTDGEMRKEDLEINNETLMMLVADVDILIEVGVWMNDEKQPGGNFITAVAPAEDFQPEAPKEPETTAPAAAERTARVPRTPRA